MIDKKYVTVNLTKANYGSNFKFKQWEIVVMKNFPYSSGKRYNIVREDSEAVNGSHTVSLHGIKISKWWLIRKIQLKVLRTILKN
jgi:hypothetical protein